MVKSLISEFKYFINDKVLIIVLIIMPIVFNIFICSVLWQETIKNIPMAVIDFDNSQLSNTITSYFCQNETFDVKYYPKSKEELEKLINNSTVKVGMIIPKDFYSDITALKSPSVMMIYDGTSMSVTSSAKARATEILLTLKTGASIKQLTAKLNIPYETAYNIAQAVQYQNRFLYNPTKSYKNFLAPMLIAGLIQASLALTATSSIREDEYPIKRKKRIGWASGKIAFYTIAGTMSFVVASVLQVYVFKVEFRGKLSDIFILSLSLCFAVSAFSIFVSSLFTKKLTAAVAGGVLFIPNSIMAGSTWPLLSMPAGYQSFSRYIPFTHFVNNFRNIFLKGTGISTMSGDILYLIAFGAAVLIISELSVIFLSDSKGEGAL